MSVTNLLYNNSILQIEVHIHLREIIDDIELILKNKIISMVGNKCLQEGFVSSNNIEIISFSEGIIDFVNVIYNVQYKCNISLPIHGQTFLAKVKSVTKAGIYSQVFDNFGQIPLTIFICKDNNNKSTINYNDIKDNDNIHVKIIDLRYELYDTTISSIGTLV